MISGIIELGKRIYDTSNPREMHRLIVFLVRALLHYSSIKSLQQFFAEAELRQRILERNPFPMEQVTRAFFYKGSTFEERNRLIQSHFEIMQENLQAEIIFKLNSGGEFNIWRSVDEGIDWSTLLCYAPGQRKEGLMSLVMVLNNQIIYQIMFWLAKDKSGEVALWIGAMQGPNMDNAREIIKDVYQAVLPL